MEITTGLKNGVAVIECKGSLDAETVALFRKRTAELFENGTFRFVLDASELAFIDSMGLGAVMSLLRRSREKKGDVKIFGLNREVGKVFEITRLNRLFDLCKDLGDACKKFG